MAKKSLTQMIPSLFDPIGSSGNKFVNVLDDTLQAREFAESMREKLKKEGSDVDVEQRNNRVIFTFPTPDDPDVPKEQVPGTCGDGGCEF